MNYNYSIVIVNNPQYYKDWQIAIIDVPIKNFKIGDSRKEHQHKQIHPLTKDLKRHNKNQRYRFINFT